MFTLIDRPEYDPLLFRHFSQFSIELFKESPHLFVLVKICLVEMIENIFIHLYLEILD
jgi:hypothetical protein